jgi:hypothetical protein
LVAALLAVALPSGAGAEPSCFSVEHTRAQRLMQDNLDGDGVKDAVWVGARRQEGWCRFYVFVRTSTAGRSRVRLRARDKFNRYSQRHNARPIALIRVDAILGREIALKLLQGASVRPFGFFTMRQGRLRRMGIQGKIAKPLAAEDMFAFRRRALVDVCHGLRLWEVASDRRAQPRLSEERHRGALHRGAPLV